jgi:hypothetical protein
MTLHKTYPNSMEQPCQMLQTRSGNKGPDSLSQGQPIRVRLIDKHEDQQASWTWLTLGSACPSSDFQPPMLSIRIGNFSTRTRSAHCEKNT